MRTLEYDFGQEKAFSYKNLSQTETVKHISKFISGLWQIHAFGEGNTRTTAIFAIKYLRTFGFKIENDMFASHSWYFRNALVRANFNDSKNNIHATTEYLMQFFGNLLFGEHNELKNRLLHIRAAQLFPNTAEKNEEAEEKTPVKVDALSDTLGKSDTLSDVLNDTLKEVLLFIKQNPKSTQEETAKYTGKAIATVKRSTQKLVSLGMIIRINGKRNGYWKIIEPKFRS